MNKIIILACAVFMVAGSLAWAAPKPLVLVTLSDMATIVRAVAGDMVETRAIMPPGADPHAFTITAEQVRDFGNAALIVYAYSEYHEFEHAIKTALPGKPSLDWADYAAHGGVLHDVPDYPQNPHAPWLYLPNAGAIARAVAERLERMGLPREALQARLSLFGADLQAMQRRCLTLAQERGLTDRPMLAIVPGVCDAIANFGVPVGDVLMAEGTGTVAGKRLQQAVNRLRDGTYSAVVCPLSMRQSKQGEAARQVASDSGAPLVYVHFLDAKPEQDTYLSLAADNMAAIAGLSADRKAQASQPSASAGRPWAWPLILIVAVLAAWWIGKRTARPSCPVRGAGIFDADPSSHMNRDE